MLNFVVLARGDWSERYDFHVGVRIKDYPAGTVETRSGITPGNHDKKTFFLSTGAEALENAVKIARKFTGRKGIISFERGFHGRTYMAMSLTSKVKPYKYEFGPFAPETYKWPYPNYYRSEGLSGEDPITHY